MGDGTTIGWTSATWNVIRALLIATGKLGWACVRTSPGCTHCYAAEMNGWRGTGPTRGSIGS